MKERQCLQLRVIKNEIMPRSYRILLLIPILVFQGLSTIAQPKIGTIRKIMIYVLPKDMEFRQQITPDRIKILNDTRVTALPENSKSFKFVSEYTKLLGARKYSSKSVDVRLLIELIDESGEYIRLSISETELIQVNSAETYEVKDLKKLINKLRCCIPRNFQW